MPFLCLFTTNTDRLFEAFSLVLKVLYIHTTYVMRSCMGLFTADLPQPMLGQHVGLQ